jgi:hypothetical protein
VVRGIDAMPEAAVEGARDLPPRYNAHQQGAIALLRRSARLVA